MPAMFIALSDGKTIADLAGCTIVSVPDGTSVEEISKRAEILYTFTGDETTNYPDAFAALRRKPAPVMPQSAPGPFRPDLSEAERARVRGRMIVDGSETLRPHRPGEPADAIRDAISDLRAYARSIGAEIDA